MVRHRRLVLSTLAFAVLVVAVWSLSAGARSDAGPGYVYRIDTISGDGSDPLAPPDHVAATQSSDPAPADTVMDSQGNLFILDYGTNHIRQVAPNGIITTIASGAPDDDFRRLAVDPQDRLFVTRGQGHYDVLRVGSGGGFTRVAGGGHDETDGAPALQAYLNQPEGIAFDGAGHLWIAETGHIAEIENGKVRLVIGNGSCDNDGTSAPAASTGVCGEGIAFDHAGNLFVADDVNARVLRITPGLWLSSVAGTGHQGFSGDGGPAVDAKLGTPVDVDVDAGGSVYIADAMKNRIRVVDNNGIISTFAGNGIAGFAGDGAAPKQAELNSPEGVMVEPDGSVVIADYFNNRVRRVTKHSLPTTVPTFGTVPPTLPHVTAPTVLTTQPVLSVPGGGDPEAPIEVGVRAVR
jgi:sugar lactone lactonase YvrE